MKKYILFILILVVINLLVLVTFFAGLESFFLYIILYGLIVGLLTSLVHSNLKKNHNSNIKAIQWSFLLYLLSTTIFLQIGLMFEFMSIKLEDIPTNFVVFSRGLLFSIIKSIYIFVIAYFVFILVYLVKKRFKTSVKEDTH
jgi:hypothetical protein